MNLSVEMQCVAAIVTGVAVTCLCLVLHAFFMVLALRSQTAVRTAFPGLHGTGLLLPSLLAAIWIIVVSGLLQVVIWAGVLEFYCDFPAPADALYFSANVYTTLGSARNELPAPYRMLEPIVAGNGILTNGLNTALLFAILADLARRHSAFEHFFRER